MIQKQGKAKNLRDIVDEIMDRWRAGDRPNALSVFAELPEVLQHHSLAIDLAYEEYCLREESGEALDPKQFCKQFSSLRHSLGRMLQLHGLMQSTSLGMPAEKEVDWPAIGEPWLDWVLIEEIGRGAFSRVFLAEEPALGQRRVVVKCSLSGPSEAFVLGKFAHPNLMPVYSIRTDEERGLVGICMPLLGRVTLAQVLDRVANSNPEAISPRIFSPEYGDWPDTVPSVSAAERKQYALEAVKKIEQVARGLEAAHQLRVLHGDIKPSNILLSAAGEPMLVDFNLSVTDALSTESAPQQRLGGTPPYMAPERLSLLTLEGLKSGRSREAEYRSDVFSLGVMLHELLFGAAPYELQWTDVSAAYEPASRDEPERLDVAGQPVAAELLTIIKRAIQLDPAARYSSAQELADALAGYLRFEQRRVKVLRRSKLAAFALAGLATLALMVFLAVPSAMWTSDYWELRQAIADIEARRFLPATERLEEIQKRHPSAEVSAWLAYCSSQMNQISNAEKQFETSHPDSDPSGRTWYNIGCCRMMRNALPSAQQAFDQALRLNPGLAEAYAQRAVVQMRISVASKLPAAPGTYRDMLYATALAPSDPHLLFDAAQVYAQGSKNYPALKPKAEEFILLSLKNGISPTSFRGTTFASFEIDRLLPSELPPNVPPQQRADEFLPPAADLRAIFH